MSARRRSYDTSCGRTPVALTATPRQQSGQGRGQRSEVNYTTCNLLAAVRRTEEEKPEEAVQSERRVERRRRRARKRTDPFVSGAALHKS